MSQTTQFGLETKDCIFLGKFLYIQFIPQIVSTVTILIKVKYTSTPNSHKFKPSTEKYEVNNLKGNIFSLSG